MRRGIFPPSALNGPRESSLIGAVDAMSTMCSAFSNRSRRSRMRSHSPDNNFGEGEDIGARHIPIESDPLLRQRRSSPWPSITFGAAMPFARAAQATLSAGLLGEYRANARRKILGSLKAS